jgi:hypothetical protein
MKNINWNQVEEASEYKRLSSGGYVCKITKVEDVLDKEYLKIEYDIIDGEFANYFQNLFDAKQFWAGKFIKSYKDSAQKFFKGFLTATESSNKGFKFDNDEAKLVGKFIGLVVGEEEYNKADGTIGTRLYVDRCTNVDKIKSGEFLVPDFKKLPVSAQEKIAWEAMSASGDDELPF